MCNDNRTMFAVFHSLIEIEKPSSLTVSHNMNKILSEKCKQSQETLLFCQNSQNIYLIRKYLPIINQKFCYRRNYEQLASFFDKIYCKTNKFASLAGNHHNPSGK